MFLCIGNINCIICLICVELVIVGFIKSIIEMDFYYKLYKENFGFWEISVGFLVCCFNLIKYVIFFFLLFLSYKEYCKKY